MNKIKERHFSPNFFNEFSKLYRVLVQYPSPTPKKGKNPHKTQKTIISKFRIFNDNSNNNNNKKQIINKKTTKTNNGKMILKNTAPPPPPAKHPLKVETFL